MVVPVATRIRRYASDRAAPRTFAGASHLDAVRETNAVHDRRLTAESVAAAVDAENRAVFAWVQNHALIAEVVGPLNDARSPAGPQANPVGRR